MIYFIGDKELDLCKIGFSQRPYRRIETIRQQTPFKLEIFDIIKGDRKLEKAIQDSYEKCRVRGEWFKLSEIKELGLFGNVKPLRLGEFTAYYDSETQYLHAPSAIAYINELRLFRYGSNFLLSYFLNKEKEFLETFYGKHITKEKYLHPYVFIEMFRQAGVECKIFIYEHMEEVLKLAKTPLLN